MSTEVAEPVPLIEEDSSRRALRLGLAVAAGFTVAEGMDWSFSFLPPMLAVTLLTRPRCPSAREGLGIVLGMALAMAFALGLTAVLITSPAAMIVGLGTVLFLTFYAQARGVPDGLVFLVQIALVAEPVMAVVDWSLAQALARIMIYGAAAAVVIAWAAYAILPDRRGPARATAAAQAPDVSDPGRAVWQAAARTLVLLPPYAWFVLDATQVSLVCLMVVLMVIRRLEPGMSGKVAVGLILGNLLGGLLAAVFYNVVQLHHTLMFFAVACLAVSLLLADATVRPGPWAPVAAVTFTTFLIVLGLGLSPLPGGSEETFASRLVNVLIASAYAVGAMALVVRSRRAA